MLFNVSERFHLLRNVIPANVTGEDLLCLKLIRKFKEELSFDESELALLEFKEENVGDGRLKITWKNDVVGEKDIEVRDTIKTYMKKVFEKMAAEGRMEEQYLEFYEGFLCEEIKVEEVPVVEGKVE